MMSFDLSKKFTRHVQTVTVCTDVNVTPLLLHYHIPQLYFVSNHLIGLFTERYPGCTCSMFRRSKQLPGQYPLPLKIDHPGFVLVTETLALADREVCLAHLPTGPNSYILQTFLPKDACVGGRCLPNGSRLPREILDVPLHGW